MTKTHIQLIEEHSKKIGRHFKLPLGKDLPLSHIEIDEVGTWLCFIDSSGETIYYPIGYPVEQVGVWND